MKPARNHKDIYVTDIDFDVTEEQVRQLFSLCGSVRMVQMQTNAQDQFNGTAYIRMADEKQTREAIDMLDGTLLQNRCIKVALSRSKEERMAPVVDEKNEKSSRRRRAPKGRRR